jgi:hypothetical protein
MSDVVEYILRLKDELSGTLGKVTGNIDAMNTKMEASKEMVAGLSEAFLGFMAIEKVIEFGKESVDKFNEAAQASAQLTASLESTNYAIGLSKAVLDEQAEALGRVTLYEKDVITHSQGILATFTQVSGQIAKDATPAILDMAAKMGIDLKEATVQVGKALNDPLIGMMALRRVGVSFTQDQVKVIKSLVETGHAADAQRLILKELNTDFGGSAEAAAKVGTGPLTLLGHRFTETKIKVGELITKLEEHLIPVMDTLINVVGTSVQFITEHKDAIMEISAAVAAFITPILVVTTAIKVWTAVQWLLNAAIAASGIGLMVQVLAALAAGMYVAYNRSKDFKAVMDGVGAVLKSLWPILEGTGKMMWGIFTGNVGMIKEGLSNFKQGAVNVGYITSTYTNAHDLSLANSNIDELKAKQSQWAKEAAKAVKAVKTRDQMKSTSTEKVTGSKTQVFQINIQRLNGIENNTSTTIKESTSAAAQGIARALIATVNDAQRAFGQ